MEGIGRQAGGRVRMKMRRRKKERTDNDAEESGGRPKLVRLKRRISVSEAGKNKAERTTQPAKSLEQRRRKYEEGQTHTERENS